MATPQAVQQGLPASASSPHPSQSQSHTYEEGNSLPLLIPGQVQQCLAISSSSSSAEEDSRSASPSLSQFTFAPVQKSEQTQQEQSRDLNYLSSSPRRYTTDFTSPIPEECDETESEPPNEPITPISGSGRQSRDFHAVEHHDTHPHYSDSRASTISTSDFAAHPDLPINTSAKVVPKPSLLIETTDAPLQPPQDHRNSLTAVSTTATSPLSDQPIPPIERRFSASTRGSFIRRTSSSLGSKMTSLFKRTNSNVSESATREFREMNLNNGISGTPDTSTPNKITPNSSRHFTWHRSSITTRSNSPPSPGSPLEIAPNSRQDATRPTVPDSNDFFENEKKTRTSTGFSLRGRVNFSTHGHKNSKQPIRRTRSVERKQATGDLDNLDLTHQIWAIAPETGTGMKARRLSLSLPDDFTVDVADLLKEFEYQHKLLGRHGKHLGKGATSKVTLMARKGSPGELYAVKEFRGKNSSETAGEYEKKIKSEYSIAKSLHHPNIVETIRLCTDHGRWNHVMEYCSEGDLFSLVSKKYLTDENHRDDRLCLFKQLIQGINYLHSNGIAHRDIKLENLLITKDSKLKITDFGVSEVFSGIHPGLREAGGQCGQGMGDVRLCKPAICGSLPYIAPEVLKKDREYDPRALDVWSAAIVMIYLTFGANLWEKADAGSNAGRGNGNYIKLVQAWERCNVRRAKNPDQAKEIYPKVDAFDICIPQIALKRLLLNMLNPDPEKRMTIAEVSNNRWMKGVECCQLESYEDPTKFIDASKKDCMKVGAGKKIYCHNHLPLQSSGHGLPPMPGKAGY